MGLSHTDVVDSEAIQHKLLITYAALSILIILMVTSLCGVLT